MDGDAEYATEGEEETLGVKNEDLGGYERECYLWAVGATCTEEEQVVLAEGRGWVREWILVGQDGEGTNGTRVDGRATAVGEDGAVVGGNGTARIGNGTGSAQVPHVSVVPFTGKAGTLRLEWVWALLALAVAMAVAL